MDSLLSFPLANLAVEFQKKEKHLQVIMVTLLLFRRQVSNVFEGCLISEGVNVYAYILLFFETTIRF